MCLLRQNCNISILYIISPESVCAVKQDITGFLWVDRSGNFVENLIIVNSIQGISKKNPSISRNTMKIINIPFSQNPIFCKWRLFPGNDIITDQCFKIYPIHVFIENRFITILSDGRNSSIYNLTSNNHKFRCEFMGKHV